MQNNLHVIFFALDCISLKTKFEIVETLRKIFNVAISRLKLAFNMV